MRHQKVFVDLHFIYTLDLVSEKSSQIFLSTLVFVVFSRKKIIKFQSVFFWYDTDRSWF